MRTQRTIFAVLALVYAAFVGAILATTPAVDISSAGPLIHIWIGEDLSQQVEHTDDAPDYEFYPPDILPADAGTFVVIGDTLYAPDFFNHDASSAGFLIGDFTAFTAVSQSAVTGSGTGGDPYQVVTVVDAADTGLRITQTDQYVVGHNFYSTSILLENSSGGTLAGVLYRAGDSFVAGSDLSYGFTEALGGGRTAVGTSEHPNNSPAGKIIEWKPTTGGNNYLEDHYDTVWGSGLAFGISAHVTFVDTCLCSTFVDSGAGLSWEFSIPDGDSATYAHDTVFQPIAATPTPTPTPTPTNTPTPTPTPTPAELAYAVAE